MKLPLNTKIQPPPASSCSIFYKLFNCWWKGETDITSNTLTHWTKNGPYCLMWEFRKCTPF